MWALDTNIKSPAPPRLPRSKLARERRKWVPVLCVMDDGSGATATWGRLGLPRVWLLSKKRAQPCSAKSPPKKPVRRVTAGQQQGSAGPGAPEEGPFSLWKGSSWMQPDLTWPDCHGPHDKAPVQYTRQRRPRKILLFPCLMNVKNGDIVERCTCTLCRSFRQSHRLDKPTAGTERELEVLVVGHMGSVFNSLRCVWPCTESVFPSLQWNNALHSRVPSRAGRSPTSKGCKRGL